MKKIICSLSILMIMSISAVHLHAMSNCVPCDSCDKISEEVIIPINQSYLLTGKNKLDSTYYNWNVRAEQKICGKQIFIELKDMNTFTNDSSNSTYNTQNQIDHWTHFGYDLFLKELIKQNIDQQKIKNFHAKDTIEIITKCCYSLQWTGSKKAFLPCGDCCCKMKYCFEMTKCQDGSEDQWTLKYLWWLNLDDIDCNGKECGGKNSFISNGTKFYY